VRPLTHHQLRATLNEKGQIEAIMHDVMFWMGVRTDPDFWALNNRLQNVKFSSLESFWNVYEWDVSE
jgi:hypothetical protein